jgi:hypothetical protein
MKERREGERPREPGGKEPEVMNDECGMMKKLRSEI